MKYLGGKYRQRKHIVRAAKSLPKFTTYVEPFCGAMWSAVGMIEAFPNIEVILNDANPYLMCFWRAAIEDGFDPPQEFSEADYLAVKRRMDVSDPLTGYVGFALSFGGRFFEGFGRGRGNYTGEGYRATMKKLSVLRRADVELTCLDYSEVQIPDGSLVYLDPPYVNRKKQSNKTKFDPRAYYPWANKLAGRCTVIATEFLNPVGWQVLHNFGDTVVRHFHGKPRDGTQELLMRVM